MGDEHATHLVPNAHIDVAWLWEKRETREQVVPNTFRDVLDVMDQDPELTYTQSQALFYVWIEQDHPDLLARIQAAVAAGRWEPSGGAWVEPDANLPCGESLVRQHLLGQRTYERLFGRRARVAWLPDTFGFNGNLPQILRHCGVDCFYTAKMLFNLYCRSLDAPRGRPFEKQAFRWQGIDGSCVLAYCSPLFYNTVLKPQWLQEHRDKRDAGLPLSLLPFGRGDHGGGPTADEMAVARAERERLGAAGSSEYVQVTTAEQFFEVLSEYRDELPLHEGELYLENHRGCATTEGRIKRANRVLGHRLTGLEKLLACRRLSGGTQEAYPLERLRELWEVYLTNQFHDILCGSSIPPVHTEAVADYASLEAELEALTWNELNPRQQHDLLLFNPLSWARDDWTILPEPHGDAAHRDWQRSALEGEAGLVVPLPEVPGLGAIRLRLDLSQAPIDAPGTSDAIATEHQDELRLENEHLRVRISKTTGNLTSVVSTALGQELLAGEGNRLQVLSDAEDLPGMRHQFSAWNVAYEPTTTDLDRADAVSVVERGPLRAAVRIERRTARSPMIQEVFLRRGDPVLHCRLHVDWQETYTMLKVCFPLTVEAREASYEIPFGAIARPTHTETPEAEAKFENAAWQWIDLSSETGATRYGAALLNDGKQGGDVRGDRLRLTLLRSPMYPAPDCDKGRHRIGWGFYPHAGGWAAGGVVPRGYAFNAPLLAVRTEAEPFTPPLTVHPPRVIVAALKRAEDDDAWILRLYESSGAPTRATITFAQPPQRVEASDGLESPSEPLELQGGVLSLDLRAFQVVTLRFTAPPPSTST